VSFESSSVVASQRTRTPPELKWLLNERAAVAGQLLALHKAAEWNGRRLLALEALLESRRNRASELKRLVIDAELSLSALDSTMAFSYPEVRPDAGGLVKPHIRFGRRGTLTQFVLDTVTKAGSEGLPTRRLTDMAGDHFGIPVTNNQERKSLRFAVRNRLRELRDLHGLVVSLRGATHSSDTFWRLRPETTLSDLQTSAQLRAPLVDVHDHRSSTNELGGQVAGQRAGDAGGRDGED
jgi:hypothetical protein